MLLLYPVLLADFQFNFKEIDFWVYACKARMMMILCQNLWGRLIFPDMVEFILGQILNLFPCQV